MWKGIAVVAGGLFSFFGVLKMLEAYDRKQLAAIERETADIIRGNERLRRQLIVMYRVKPSVKKARKTSKKRSS